MSARPALPELLTTAEVAAIVREHQKTVARRIRAGQIPACRLPGHRGHYLVSRTDLDAYLAGLPAASTVTPIRARRTA